MAGGKPVAVAGDVSATAIGTTGGLTWTITPPGVVETPYAFLTVGGKAVLSGAKCDFTGKAPNGATTPSSVTLPKPGAPATTLQHGASNVLRNGDSNRDQYGNTLTVTATGILTSE